MKQENFNIIQDSKGKSLPGKQGIPRKLRILVAPLDWGLGHATRCIPVIYALLEQNCEVWLAGEGSQEELLKQEFPQLPFLSLTGYRVKYSRSTAGMLWSLLSQSSRILKAIRLENGWLKKMIDKHDFDGVISDNRYGLYSKKIPCVFITHQLLIKTPFGKWSERLLQLRNYKYINRFSECWIPDEKEENNLAGELSHPTKRPAVALKYIGPLSRLKKQNEEAAGIVKDHLLIILSGPEPQRTILENIIVDNIAHYNGTATILRGLPGTLNLIPSTTSIRFYNHLATAGLNEEMRKADYIISRSGYSTVMDISALQKKSILIPTPGQTEQEYLGRYLQDKKIAITIPQKNFSLMPALELAKVFPYADTNMRQSSLHEAVVQFVRTLDKH